MNAASAPPSSSSTTRERRVQAWGGLAERRIRLTDGRGRVGPDVATAQRRAACSWTTRTTSGWARGDRRPDPSSRGGKFILQFGNSNAATSRTATIRRAECGHRRPRNACRPGSSSPTAAQAWWCSTRPPQQAALGRHGKRPDDSVKWTTTRTARPAVQHAARHRREQGRHGLRGRSQQQPHIQVFKVDLQIRRKENSRYERHRVGITLRLREIPLHAGRPERRSGCSS